jgi:hypothetical protein
MFATFFGRYLPILAVSATVAVASCGALTPPEGVGSGDTFSARATAPDDAVSRGILAGGKPATIFEVRKKLKGFGGRFDTHIVANRGHGNPEAGSFSFFESYSGPIPGGTVKAGELFIGFFSERQGDHLAVQQSFDPGLMIELIAWDRSKELFNFWELVGDGKASQWHYRGDSDDILADIAEIHTGKGHATFGGRLRCSGCHTLGGPIFKEQEAPHNDWWTDRRKLALGSLKLAEGASETDPRQVAGTLFREAEDASNLALLVTEAQNRYVARRVAQAGTSRRPAAWNLKHALRSLFATMEMNLVSDSAPLAERAGAAIAVPAGFFIDPLLAGKSGGRGRAPAPVAIGESLYRQGLARAGSRFAPDEAHGLPDTHHAFLVPARSALDTAIVDGLTRRGLIDDELVADVLAVDFTTPIYSRYRAGLVRYLPENAAGPAELRAALIGNLQAAQGDPAARELLANLTDPARTAAAHRQAAAAFVTACGKLSGDPAAVFDWLRVASQRRIEIDADETAMNPRGKITEPGFRVIFPVDNLRSKPGHLRLRPSDCRVG